MALRELTSNEIDEFAGGPVPKDAAQTDYKYDGSCED